MLYFKIGDAMNKKRVLIILMFAFTFFLTGCVKYELDMGVNSDKSFTLTIINAIQNEYVGISEGESDFSKYEQLGYDVEKYADSTHSGLKLIKKFKNIDEVSSANSTVFELTSLLGLKTTDFKLFKSEKQGTITKYTANFTYDLTIDETSEETNDYSEYSNTMIFKYEVSFPSNITIISNNADTKETRNDLTALVWNMQYGELKNINFVFSIDDNNLKEVENNNDSNDINENNTVPPFDNNSPDTNDSNNVQDETIETEEQEKLETIYVENNGNIFASIFATLFAIAMVLGIIVYKIKLKKDSVTPKITMSHATPPKK